MTTPTNPTPAIRKPSSGLFTTSNFESMSHEQLRAMIEHADPAGTQDLGVKLQVAAATIKKIGEDLKGHMAKVEWAGQGGDSFREWGTDMANAALRLGEFSHNTGSWMIDAAATLSGVKSSMPEVSTESKTVLDSFRANYPGQVGATVPAPDQGGALSATASGPSQAQAYAAQQRLDADRAEAARLMRKLAESYSWSAHQISTGERPTFRPMPNTIPGDGDVSHDREYVGGTGGSRQGYQGGAGSPAMSLIGGGSRSGDRAGVAMPGVGGPGSAGGAPSDGRRAPVPPDGNVGTEIDGVAPMPTAPSTLPAGHADSHGGGRVDGGSPSLSGVVVPSTALPGSPASRSGIPPLTRQPMSTGPGMGAGRPSLAVPRIADPGIVGGRPVPPGQGLPTGQASRGTAIGAEGQGQAQGRLPMGAGPVVGGSPGASSRTGMVTGRRLATEPGGVVGGRPVQRPGAAGEFTPGGAGLVRSHPTAEGSALPRGGVQGSAFLAPSAAGGALSRRGRGGQRPDYLVEDEETWSKVHRRVVPPVIE